MIRFFCSYCDKVMHADQSKLRTRIKCPACGHWITVPDAGIPAASWEDEMLDKLDPLQPEARRASAASPLIAQGRRLVQLIAFLIILMHVIGVVQYAFAPGNVVALAGGAIISGALVVFLWLRHDWARFALAVVLIIGAAVSIFRFLFGGWGALQQLSTGLAALTIVEMLVRIGVCTIGAAILFRSESVAVYSSSD